MNPLILIILIVLLFGGGGTAWRFDQPYVGGGLGLVALVLIILLLTGRV